MTTLYAPRMTKPDEVSRAEAADILGVSVQAIDRYARAGLLTRRKNPITKRTTFSRHEVDQLRAQREGDT